MTAIVNWHWYFSGGTPSESSAQNPDVCYNIPGTFNVTLIATTEYGCKDTLKKPWYINVYDLPTADFAIIPDTMRTLLTPSFQFENNWSNNVVSWQWDFGDGSPLESTIANPNHSYGPNIDNNTYYSYLVTVYVQTEHGCRDSIVRRVEVTPDFSFFIPNTFTPNGDYDNDYFYGKGRGISDYTISIYDRWGILLWTCHESGLNTEWDKYSQDGMPSTCQWDGTLDNASTDRKVQNDVYIWRVSLTTIFGVEKTFIGHVTAIR
jgi:gliding motility-associated-like protein